jgi:hypothetical protein
VATILTLSAVTAGLAAQTRPLTEARVRTMTRQARTTARGDATALVLELDRQFRETWGEFESFPLSIVRREELLVSLSSPYMAYRRSVVDVLRTGRRVEDAVWVNATVLTVDPMRLDAPDIFDVVLTRAGQPVAATKNSLRPMTFEANAGQSILHAGDVHFPPAAFAPGAPVVLTLRPKTGQPIVYQFSDAELSTLK